MERRGETHPAGGSTERDGTCCQLCLSGLWGQERRPCERRLGTQAGPVGAGLAGCLRSWACLLRFWEPLKALCPGECHSEGVHLED